MLIAIICACIVGGILWRTENRIKRMQNAVEASKQDYRTGINKFNLFINAYFHVNEKITLLAKDMIEMQTTVSNLKPRSKKHANTKVNRTK